MDDYTPNVGPARTELGPVEDFLTATVKTHLIVEIVDNSYVPIGTCPHLDDGDGGLPGWFFGYIPETDSYDDGVVMDNIVNDGHGNLEWVPAIGPNPVWRAQASEFTSVQEALDNLEFWGRKMYGGFDDE